MDFYFYTNVSFEPWDYDNSIKKGIGGSETSIVEMSWRLAQHGHKVVVYAPIKKTTNPNWRGTKWIRYEKATFKEKGVWIIYRCPEIVDKFLPRRKNQQLWLLWQDWDYPSLTKKRIKGVDRHITLCKSHGRYMLKNYPDVGKRLWLSSNGIKLDLIEKIEKERWVRDPFRVMYASSPDRGLKYALQIVKKAREFEPRIHFHSFYGFNNLNKLIKGRPNSPLAKSKNDIIELLKQPNVHFHGRINQAQLMREWFKTGVWVYITNFFETSNITGMEAQACGAVPLFSPIFAQGENIKWGCGIEGSAEEPLTISRAAMQLVRMMRLPQETDKLRKPMIEYARKRFNWENFVTQWIYEAEGKRKEFEKKYDFPEQM